MIATQELLTWSFHLPFLLLLGLGSCKVKEFEFLVHGRLFLQNKQVSNDILLHNVLLKPGYQN